MFIVEINQRSNMIRFLLMSSAIMMLTSAQRPSYASSGPIGRPGLASRFKDDNASSSTTVSVENRVGEGGSTPKIPVDARGDTDLVNTLNTWDREHRPYWLLNADHIERARNTTRGTQPINNRNQFDSQNNQGSQNQESSNVQTNGFQDNLNNANRDGFSGNMNNRGGFQENNSNRGGFQDNMSNGNRGGFQDNMNNGNRGGFHDNDNRRYPPVNNDNWVFGRPQQGDIRPVYETPEGDIRVRPSQAQRQNEGTQRRLKFHYERNNFP